MLRQQVDELSNVNRDLKEKLADASHTAENAQALADDRKIQFDQLMNDYRVIKQENQLLLEEKNKYQNKYDAVCKQQQLEADRSR